ncbi:hypothetical protein CsSME_00042195 [Camellia sinensis var. sinensis]
MDKLNFGSNHHTHVRRCPRLAEPSRARVPNSFQPVLHWTGSLLPRLV